MAVARRKRRAASRPWLYLKRLGPGLVAGAADNDPTTVATMSVTGATTGFALSWLLILVYPMLAAAQVVGSQVGLVTKKGVQQLVRERYGARWGFVLMLSVLLVNLVTIAADLEAGAAAIGIVIPLDFRWFVVPYAVVLVLILFFGAYDEVQRVLKYAMLVFLAYVGAAFLAHPKWGQVLAGTIHPRVSLTGESLQAMLAVLGTTLTSYAYFWETQEQAEEGRPLGRLNLVKADAGLGMLIAVAIFWFTLIAVGATLGPQHKHIDTAQQAAEALRPIAGPAASYLFALGLLASSFIAVPVLAATCGYLVSGEIKHTASLSDPIRKAPVFYGALAFAVVFGGAVSLLGLSAIQLLFIASIVGGLGTPVSLTFLLLLAHDHRVMDGHRLGPLPLVVGWVTVAVTGAVGVYFIWDQVLTNLVHG